MTNRQPLISVIVPIYNVIKYLPACIISISRQTYNNLEIILIDDGSNDGSGDICDKYAAKDSRIKVIHTDNNGVVAARNVGVELATGDFISFIDGDDYIEPITYEQLIIQLKGDYNLDMVWFDYKVEEQSGAIYVATDFNNNSHYMLSNILSGHTSGSICNMIIRTNYYQSCAIKTYVKDCMFEDLYILVQLLCGNPKMAYVGRAFYHYVRTNVTSKTHGNGYQEVIAKEGIYNIEHIYDYLIEKGKYMQFKAEFINRASIVKLLILYYCGIKEAKRRLPFVKMTIQNIRMSPFISWMYWFAFNGGIIGEYLITLYLKVKKNTRMFIQI